ncbi:hypothetical protein [Streptomyces mirabilis]|uniref:hypothetical protein n=1 Tax=Streptomyces mirabilis TaxID=68239 RepID=UPI0036BC2327
MRHQITVEPEHRGYGRHTWNYLCSCGAKGYGHQSKGAAEHAAKGHLPRAGGR